MNNVYIYDSSQIHVYETEDLGSITDVATPLQSKVIQKESVG